MPDIDELIKRHYAAQSLPPHRVEAILSHAELRRVLAEIAMNHRKQLDVEVAAEDFSAIAGALDRLNFTVRPPPALGEAFVPVGGRYCSIQGALAAQLKLRHRETGATHTLYAAALTPALANLAEKETVFDGVSIRLWNDGEVFFGLAGQEAAPAG